jgi:diacylglycerol kinase (ATP)
MKLVCEYYVHVDCQQYAVNDCLETALYVPSHGINSITHGHHWREGNLPTNSKCHFCKKTCWTVECLAGMRCEWCGIAVRTINSNEIK